RRWPVTGPSPQPPAGRGPPTPGRQPPCRGSTLTSTYQTAGHIRHTGCDSGHRVSEDDDRGHRVSKGRPTAARLVELRAVGWRDVAQAGRRGGDGTRDGAARPRGRVTTGPWATPGGLSLLG